MRSWRHLINERFSGEANAETGNTDKRNMKLKSLIAAPNKKGE